MKKTIRADKQRNILEEKFLNDNSLFQVTITDNSNVLVGIRYVEDSRNIKEHNLIEMTIYDYMSSYRDLVKVSDDSSAVAIFTKVAEGFQLSRLYDAEEHTFAQDEFIDIVYEKKFPKLALDKHLVLKNTD